MFLCTLKAHSSTEQLLEAGMRIASSSDIMRILKGVQSTDNLCMMSVRLQMYLSCKGQSPSQKAKPLISFEGCCSIVHSLGARV